MKILVSGGSASGKSAYAENRAAALAAGCAPLIYIATMQPFGAEAEARIARHQMLRRGKGFETIERYTGLKELCVPRGAVILLECLGNLVANEIFSDEGAGNAAEDAVLVGIGMLAERSESLVIVSNDIFFDGMDYAPETVEYSRTLAKINRTLARAFDEVTELCCGLPIMHKGGKI